MNVKYKPLMVKTLPVLVLLLIALPLFSNVDTNPIRVNQVGYYPQGDKIASIITGSNSPLNWELKNSSGQTILNGTTRIYGYDTASGDNIHKADFSACTQTGTGYRLSVNGLGQSVPFDINSNIYEGLDKDAMAYFYFHRMGEPVEAAYLADSRHARGAIHTESTISAYNSWTGFQFPVRYAWADAGDFGNYPVNHAISAWTLLNLYERYKAFGDNSMNIPEKNNSIPDIIDEVKFGSTFMTGMLPSSGLASHKVHNAEWNSPWEYNNFVQTENSLSRHAQPPSTNATYAIARNLAQLARVYASYNSSYASTLWSQAKTAWNRAEAEPNKIYDTGYDDAGGGDYPDTNTGDDRYTAACELYLTAFARGDSSTGTYKSALTGSAYYRTINQFDWEKVEASGTLSLLSVPNDLSAADIQMMEGNVIAFAEGTILPFLTAGSNREEGYPAPFDGSDRYPWGSNSFFINRAIILAYAYDISGDKKFLKGITKIMDYMMGTNPMKLSYITGWGEFAEEDTHDRWAIACKNGVSAPFPKGWLSGGPNNNEINDNDTPTGQPPAKSYGPPGSGPSAWCSKENTINWNAPLAWVVWYLNSKKADLSQSDPTFITGDVNTDQVISIIDALMTAQYYVGLNPPGFNPEAADVNKDGQVTILDSLMIAQYYVGLINSF